MKHAVLHLSADWRELERGGHAARSDVKRGLPKERHDGYLGWQSK